MAALFRLGIYTPDKIVFEAEVSALCVPEDSGYLGVLAHHAPLLSTLSPGKITFKDKAGAVKVLNSPGRGVLQVVNNQVHVLLDSCDAP